MRWLVLLGLLTGCTANPDSLAQRVAQFPDYRQPAYSLTSPDLFYPDWFEGRWRLTSVLEAVEAPLGVEYTNPTNFARSQTERGEPVVYYVRFYRDDQGRVIADRVFNTISAIQASQGAKSVIEVLLAADQPDRQTIRLSGNRRGELYITRRHSERPNPQEFATLEFYRQVLGSLGRIPNTKDVETTTLYQQSTQTRITASQLIAVFLVPTDERYFNSNGRAVTAYRYRLRLDKTS
ncbi:DUF6816 family protein [Candidatus Cyanaurora vandensis]|uniref:DUF6816 family protein n=1 Tax=Candidatus Cyanaurora vandensis TaxID=2714958 RepID=UPI00257E4C9A|nr:hypothetical protein [Candidatus Cyanaurora vandensis]